MKSRLLLLQSSLADGLHWAREAHDMALAAGMTGAAARAFDIELIYATAANGLLAEALEVANRQDYEPREAGLAIQGSLRFLLSGNSDMAALRLGFVNARMMNFINLFDRARGVLAELCEAALEHGIEPDFARRLIEIKQLAPPSLAGPHWPWPVRVYSLGGFRLEIAGRAYRPARKAQEKPLELLKLLLSSQALGRDSAEKAWIADRLWPDADAENARKSLDMTVGRLRRLLGDDDALVANEGRLELSSAKVWTDVRAFLAAMSDAQTHRDRFAANVIGARDAASGAVAVVLKTYNGVFLADEDGPAWLLAGREAIAARVRQALLAADAVLDGSADPSLVPALERACTADPTSEHLARALMRAHLRMGQHAEAVRVHRRLREMLSLLLGIAPSAESDHIRDRAYQAQAEGLPNAR